MNKEKKILCHWDLVRFISEEKLNKDGVFHTLSVWDGKRELQIFLGKSDDEKEYEVEIIKCEENGNYVSHKSDKVIRFVETEEKANFFFDTYESAHQFAEYVGYFHPEYKVRPVKDV